MHGKYVVVKKEYVSPLIEVTAHTVCSGRVFSLCFRTKQQYYIGDKLNIRVAKSQTKQQYQIVSQEIFINNISKNSPVKNMVEAMSSDIVLLIMSNGSIIPVSAEESKGFEVGDHIKLEITKEEK